MRLKLLGLLALITGCGAGASPSTQTGGPMPRAVGSAASRPLWAVREFDEKEKWLDAHPALSRSEPQVWAAAMQRAVEQALDAKGADARTLPSGITDEQIKTLFAEGLNYLVEGTMAELLAADSGGTKTATLKVSYRLKRRHGNDTRVVQARSLAASLPAASVDEASLKALIPLVAKQIADAVIADVPADLLAVRG